MYLAANAYFDGAWKRDDTSVSSTVLSLSPAGLSVRTAVAAAGNITWITPFSLVNGRVNIAGLTASRAVLTDASKNLVSRTVSGDASGAVALETDVASGTWTPAFTNLTVVNGTGGATYTGGYVRIGNIVNWWAKIATSGTCTTASTFTATILNNLPFSSVSPSVCHAVRSSTGGGSISEPGWTQAGTDNAYMPSWAAYDGDIYISGVIFLV
jgi:hypothetical protein